MASVLLPAHGAGIAVLFQPSDPDVGPFPTDALTVADTGQKTGLRVSLPKPDCQAEPSTCNEIGLINELDGFNLRPRVRIRFSAPVDVDTLRLGIFIVWLDDLTDEEFGLQPRGHVTPVNQVLYDPATNTAYAEPDQILSQHRRYLLLVTDAIRDAQGSPVEPSTEYIACMAAQDAYCGRLREALDTANLGIYHHERNSLAGERA
jgi:hypothetical protein